MTRKKLSIIIVNYQSRKYLECCLDSIYTKIEPFFDFEVFIVNNDSREDVGGLEERFSKLKVLQSGSNLGFGAANNLASREATGDILLFLNPDTELLSGKLSAVFEAFESEKMAIIGGKLVGAHGAPQEWSAGYSLSLGRLMINKLFGFNSGLFGKKKALDWVSGTALFIKKAVFLELGGYDEKFFMYFEDVDLCHRARLSGYRVGYCPDFSVRHYGGASYDNRKKQKRDYYKAQDYYFQKHCGKVQACLLKSLRSII